METVEDECRNFVCIYANITKKIKIIIDSNVVQ
jgi:hypothetical protein